MKKEKRKIVIAIDGGGIRGIFPLLFLQYIESRLNKEGLNHSLSDTIDFVSGTSTGAIISAGLIVQQNSKYVYSIDQLLALYSQRGPQLFNLSNPGNAHSDGIRLLLKRKFKNLFLSDLKGDFVLVSYDKITETPFLFTKKNTLTANTPISLALAACSAIPEVFQPVKYGDKELIDGVVFAKNPAEIAFQQIQQLYPEENYLILSFGTGKMQGEMYDDIEKEAERVHQFLQDASGNGNRLAYFRLQPDILTADSRMDNASIENIAALIKDGQRYISEKEDFFKSIVAIWLEQISD